MAWAWSADCAVLMSAMTSVPLSAVGLSATEEGAAAFECLASIPAWPAFRFRISDSRDATRASSSASRADFPA